MGRALFSVAVLLALMAAILFVCAGTLDWWQAWLFLALYGGVSAVITIYLARNDPALLARRMKGGASAEARPAQRWIMAAIMLLWIASLVIPALDRRFGWSGVPSTVALLGDVLLVAGYGGIWRVFAENTYTAATVRVEVGQTLVDTGPYAFVRHPMYAAVLPMLAGMPLALGSWWGLVPVVLMVPILAWRMADEERVLVEELAGYADYRRRVRWRLLPGVF
jgi:protein-S-isoprenylcysteine O-methyltransferase Ste14